MFIMQDAQLSHDLTLLSSYSTSLLTVMSSGLLASHFQRMASQCRSLFILLGNRFAVACGVCVCGCSTLAPLYVCMKTSVCVDSNIWNTALKWKVFCFFFFFYKVLPGTFKLLSGKSRSLVYNHTRCFAFCFLFSKTYLKVISLEKGRVFAATNWGWGDNQSPALPEAKYYEKLFCFGHNFVFYVLKYLVLSDFSLFLLW